MRGSWNDADEDLNLHGRPKNRGLAAEPDREFTLNTGTLLAAFLALALVCAMFFGFGYTMGRKSAQTATAPAATDSTAPAYSESNSPKPSAGAPAAPASASTAIPSYQPQPAAPSRTENSAALSGSSISENRPSADASPDRAASSVRSDRAERAEPAPAAPIVRTGPASAVPTSSLSAALSTQPRTVPSGTFFVQVAAVSHQEDADVLLSALRRHGYTVQGRQDANDHLIHVQIGPFATRKDADAMRQRLLGDGYNAIVK